MVAWVIPILDGSHDRGCAGSVYEPERERKRMKEKVCEREKQRQTDRQREREGDVRRSKLRGFLPGDIPHAGRCIVGAALMHMEVWDTRAPTGDRPSFARVIHFFGRREVGGSPTRRPSQSNHQYSPSTRY